MELPAKFILTIAGNMTALLLTTYFDHDFIVATDTPSIISLVITLTLLNLILLPILRIIFSPLIKITFGFFNVMISAGILYLIDIYSNAITINGLWALIIGAHLMGIIIVLIDYSSTIVYGSGEIRN